MAGKAKAVQAHESLDRLAACEELMFTFPA